MGTLRAQIYEEFRQFVWNCLHKKASHCAVFAFLCSNGGSIRLILDSKVGSVVTKVCFGLFGVILS